MIELPEIARRACTITGQMILYNRDAIHLIVHEWERDGVQNVAWPDDGQIPPYDACRIGLKLFNYPTGQLRLIDFEKGARTPWHLNAHQDALFYGLDATQIEFVDEAIHHAHPGDASIHPEGVQHHSETIIGGVRVEFGFAPQGKSGHDLVAISGRDMGLHVVHEWVEDDRKKRLFRAPAAEVPANGLSYKAKLFQLPAYAILEAHYGAGTVLPLHTNEAEKIVYVIKGRMTVTTGTESGELGAGDVFRMAAGKPFRRETLTSCVVIEVDGSEAPWMFTFPQETAGTAKQ